MLRRDQRGQVTVLFALMMVLVMGFAAISVDVGRLYIARFHAQNAADAAALAGVQYLPTDPAEATAVAVQYAAKNGYAVDPSSNVQVSPDDMEIRVTVPVAVTNYFARFLGMPVSNVSAVSTARTQTLTSTQSCELDTCESCLKDCSPYPTINTSGGPSHFAGTMPWAVMTDVIPASAGGTCTSGCSTLAMLKSDRGYTGNFYAVQVDGAGGDVYRQEVAQGSRAALYTTEVLQTEPGDMVGPTEQGLTELFDNCELATGTMCASITVAVPVIDTTTFTGQTSVEVAGLAAYTFSQSDVGAAAAGVSITGSFVTAWLPQGSQPTASVNLTLQNFGTYADGTLTNQW